MKVKALLVSFLRIENIKYYDKTYLFDTKIQL